MERTLDVYLPNDLAGQLIQDEGGQMVFKYIEDWVNRPGAMPLSQSLPLRKERFSRKECRGFFAGILPEENKREIIARNLGISARNDFAMLEQIGGGIAGTVTVIPRGGVPAGKKEYAHRPSAASLCITTTSDRPLMAGSPAEGTTRV